MLVGTNRHISVIVIVIVDVAVNAAATTATAATAASATADDGGGGSGVIATNFFHCGRQWYRCAQTIVVTYSRNVVMLSSIATSFCRDEDLIATKIVVRDCS